MTKRIKRTKRIRLVLLSGISAGALASCAPGDKAPVSAANVYPNNYYVPGAGYYHAPFCAWFPLPYNHFDPAKRQYFYGGQWGTSPWQSITNISSPSAQAAAKAEMLRTDVTRGGFGCTGGTGGYYIHS
jgi:hypothetical protein